MEMPGKKKETAEIRKIVMPIIDSYNPPIAVDRFHVEQIGGRVRLSGISDGPFYISDREEITLGNDEQLEIERFRPICVVDVCGAAVWQMFFAGLSALDPQDKSLQDLFRANPEFKQSISEQFRTLLAVWGESHE